MPALLLAAAPRVVAASWRAWLDGGGSGAVCLAASNAPPVQSHQGNLYS